MYISITQKNKIKQKKKVGLCINRMDPEKPPICFRKSAKLSPRATVGGHRRGLFVATTSDLYLAKSPILEEPIESGIKRR